MATPTSSSSNGEPSIDMSITRVFRDANWRKALESRQKADPAVSQSQEGRHAQQVPQRAQYCLIKEHELN